MLAFQTLACLNDIPVIRSSTSIIQNIYTKAKDTSVLIRVPCNVAESVADKSLKIALTVANPLVKPFSGPVHRMDTYAAEKIREIESKYPAITTPTEDVVNTLSEKTEPVRNVMNSVRDTTTSTIQHGRETVSNVASATVNKATGVADSFYTFCGKQSRGNRRQSGLIRFAVSSVTCAYNTAFEKVQSSVIWSRMLTLFVVLKLKQINDTIFTVTQRSPLSNNVVQRLLIVHGAFLDYIAARVAPDDRTLTELKKSRQQPRPYQPIKLSQNRSSLRTDPSATVRQSVVKTRQETVVSQSNGSYVPSQAQADDDDDDYEINGTSTVTDDIALLHSRIQPSDIELLHSRLPGDIVTGDDDDDEPLTADQQALHARIIATESENQGYAVDEDNNN